MILVAALSLMILPAPCGEIPRNKFQSPRKTQYSKNKRKKEITDLEKTVRRMVVRFLCWNIVFGYCDFLGAWDLVLGI